ncbi:ATP-binding cassette domain-containing protein [Corticibacter populi]|uniref:ATP-binding cassette domain-containing protein n=2 Tax=Corticibacter populi TaxID=1550736 RepID=A0A3M6R0T4_9BURK|nr:ATP-binding cassette domain-containing protein [Corticibacter populi]
MALGMLLAACTTLTGAALLGLSGWFITATAIAGLSSAAALAFNVFTPSAGIRLLALGRTASRYGERLVTHAATLAALVDVRERLFRAFARPLAARPWQLRPARLLFRLTRDLDAAESLYLRLLVPLCAALAMTLGMAGWLAWLSPWLGLAALLWLLATGLGISGWLLRSSARLSAEQMRLTEQLRTRMSDLCAGQTDLLMAGQYEARRQQLLAAERRLARLDDRLQQRDAMAGWTWQALHSATLAAALLAGSWLVWQGRIGAASAALLALMVLAATEAFAALRRGAQDWGRALLSARRLQAPLQAGGTAGGPPSLPAPPAGMALQMRDARALLRPEAGGRFSAGVTLQIAEGERVALVGPSGCGKSTLLALACGERRPAQGHIAALPACWLTQRTELFQDSLRGNLNLQERPLDDAQLMQGLRDAGLAELVAERQGGLDCLLGEGGLGLSGGQARRLALARLLLSQQRFWLLDEPTEGIDAEVAHDVLQRLAAHIGTRTVLMATHLRREARLASRLIELAPGGRILADVRHGDAAYDDLLRRLRPD